MQTIFGRQLKFAIQNTAVKKAGDKMLKIRLMGTKNDIKWFNKVLKKNKKLKVLQISDIFSNKGTNKYHREYVEVEKVKEKNKKEKNKK